MMNARMQSPLLDLLKQIDAGVTIYEPFARTPEKLREFADTVARLEEMKELRLVRQLFTQTRTSFGEEQIIMVMVVGGLTEEGRRLLGEPDKLHLRIYWHISALKSKITR